MAFTAVFDTSDKFNLESAYADIRFGKDAPLLEVELNEMQKIQREARAALFREQTPSGILSLDTSWSNTSTKSLTTAENRASLVNSLYSTSVFNAFQIKNLKALVNGYLINLASGTDSALEILLNAPPVPSTGTAQAGTSTTITLAAGASAANNFYKKIRISAGTGIGQVRYISSYNGSTKVATVSSAWTVTPDSTSVYVTDEERDDLVFLEAWFEEVTKDSTVYKYGGVNSGTVTNGIMDSRVGAETSRRTQLKWRIRVVDGVTFSAYPDGFPLGWSDGYDNRAAYTFATPQGGKVSPITQANSTTKQWHYFMLANTTARVSGNFSPWANADLGLYIAGDGTVGSKTALLTADGYVYAIPLFKVRRRNNAGYSAANPCGARDLFITSGGLVSGTWLYGTTQQITVGSGDYTNLLVGDYIASGLSKPYTRLHQVISKDGNNKVTFMNVTPSLSSETGSIIGYFLVSERPDGLYSNIIDRHDITWLAHKVSLNGFNFNQMLNEVVDALFTI